jgi:N-acetyl-anhydromuramyl-L-alanine amidase AmpD
VTGFGQALLADYPPAQVEVVRQLMQELTARMNQRPS